jgi:hypothetical protein
MILSININYLPKQNYLVSLFNGEVLCTANVYLTDGRINVSPTLTNIIPHANVLFCGNGRQNCRGSN